MAFAAWLTLIVLLAVFGLLLFSRLSPDVVIVGAVAVLLLAGVLDGEGALHGMSNEGVMTIGVLFIVAAGIRDTGAMDAVMHVFLGRPKSEGAAQLRLMVPSVGLSAFMNNTPLVAMLIPVVSDWSKKLNTSASRLLMPLSVASILGGACTLVGTSTNLIVNGWLISEADMSLGMFEVGKVAFPLALIGISYTVIAGRFLLPRRDPVIDLGEDPRQYTVELIVEEGGPLHGKTIEQAGLRRLPGLFLVEIDRKGQVMPAVSSNVKLRSHDRLVFVGVIESVVDLQKTRGLTISDQQVYKLDVPRTNRTLVEAVVSNTCPLVGRTIREGGFRTRYQAVVIAVGRNGERISGKLGDIRLKAGDTLLLEARADFAKTMRDSRDFYLVSDLEGTKPRNHDKWAVALAALVLMVVLVSVSVLSMLEASALAAGIMLATGCCDVQTARSSVNWQVLVVIAASLGLGRAVDESGLADAIAGVMLLGVAGSPYLALSAIFGLTMLLASAVTAQNAAVLVLPIAKVLALTMGLHFSPFAIAVMLGASTTVTTPIASAASLMVMGPAGYRFSDYIKFGGPLNLIFWAVATALIPLFWPF